MKPEPPHGWRWLDKSEIGPNRSCGEVAEIGRLLSDGAINTGWSGGVVEWENYVTTLTPTQLRDLRVSRGLPWYKAPLVRLPEGFKPFERALHALGGAV